MEYLASLPFIGKYFRENTPLNRTASWFGRLFWIVGTASLLLTVGNQMASDVEKVALQSIVLTHMDPKQMQHQHQGIPGL
ncbi:ATP-dependent Clp protease ATP-binding subunit [Acrasis kona]|uniref:ATP-dependent Clp protease ATP-binding subunit n=1 Tax=Acrasis kona TaxID=1008807 RepID=A0AAW2Z0Z3_9EUKA